MPVIDAVAYVAGTTKATPKPWLVVGKGPSADRILSVPVADYHVLTLNHACQITKPTLAHFVDLEAFLDCHRDLVLPHRPVCLPWYPHVNNSPSRLPLPRHESELLYRLARNGLVCSYNATTTRFSRNPDLRDVRLRFFSAVGAFNLLGLAGVKELHSLGVDGGKAYGKAFDAKDRLANGRPSFDVQEDELRRAATVYKMAWKRL